MTEHIRTIDLDDPAAAIESVAEGDVVRIRQGDREWHMTVSAVGPDGAVTLTSDPLDIPLARMQPAPANEREVADTVREILANVPHRTYGPIPTFGGDTLPCRITHDLYAGATCSVHHADATSWPPSRCDTALAASRAEG